jgi:hypothetical protein
LLLATETTSPRERIQPPKQVMVQNGVDEIVAPQREVEAPPREVGRAPDAGHSKLDVSVTLPDDHAPFHY